MARAKSILDDPATDFLSLLISDQYSRKHFQTYISRYPDTLARRHIEQALLLHRFLKESQRYLEKETLKNDVEA